MILMHTMMISYILDPVPILATVLIRGIGPFQGIEGQLTVARLTAARLMGAQLTGVLLTGAGFLLMGAGVLLMGVGVLLMEVTLLLPQQYILPHLILVHMPVLSQEVSPVQAFQSQCLAQFMDRRLESRWLQALPMVVSWSAQPHIQLQLASHLHIRVD